MPTINVELNLSFGDFLNLAAQAFEREHPGTKLIIAYSSVSDQLMADPDARDILPTLVGSEIKRAAAEATRKKLGL